MIYNPDSEGEKRKKKLRINIQTTTRRSSEGYHNILHAAKLGASEVSDRHHLISRWEASSILLRLPLMHEPISSSFDYFLH